MKTTVTINGRALEVIGTRTIEEIEQAHPNLAADFRRRGIVAEVQVKKGTKLGYGMTFANGSTVVAAWL